MKNLHLPKKSSNKNNIYYLKQYLKKKKRSLTIKQKEYIQKLIGRKEKAIEKEALLYENSSLLHLAIKELIREKQITRIMQKERTTKLIEEKRTIIIKYKKISYKIKSVAELVLKMLETVNLAHDKGFGDTLNRI